MTLKQFIKNLKFKNLIYIIAAKYKKFIRKEYNKYYESDKLEDIYFKIASCPDCYLNGSCLECGCDFKEMITTNKPCPNEKW